jgi:predicted DNA-binding protein YlxM (UPF0122 family)
MRITQDEADIYLAYDRGQAPEEIAARRGIPIEAVKKAIRRAQKRLGLNPKTDRPNRSVNLNPSLPDFDFPEWLYRATKGRIGMHFHTSGNLKDFVKYEHTRRLERCCRLDPRQKCRGIRLNRGRETVLLTFRQSLVFKLFFVGGIEQSGIAQILGVTAKGVEAVIARVRRVFSSVGLTLHLPAHKLDAADREFRRRLFLASRTQTTSPKTYKQRLSKGFRQPEWLTTGAIPSGWGKRQKGRRIRRMIRDTDAR